MRPAAGTRYDRQIDPRRPPARTTGALTMNACAPAAAIAHPGWVPSRSRKHGRTKRNFEVFQEPLP
jgi:hypothetical protein